MENAKVEQFGAKNQFLIYSSKGVYFQSYDSMIALKTGRKIILDEYYWDYSKTTGKYRNRFLGETKKETQRKIDSGIYELRDLNK